MTRLDKQAISSEQAPKALGPYSAGIRFGSLVFTAGQLGIIPASGDLAPGGIDAETRQALENIRAILNEYKSHGIRHIVALRGDLPSGTQDVGEFRYANELVAFIRAETGDDFHIEVAAYPEYHPQAQSAQADLANFKRKVDAGANAAITQYFYNADAYFNFRDECDAMGIAIPRW